MDRTAADRDAVPFLEVQDVEFADITLDLCDSGEVDPLVVARDFFSPNNILVVLFTTHEEVLLVRPFVSHILMLFYLTDNFTNFVELHVIATTS